MKWNVVPGLQNQFQCMPLKLKEVTPGSMRESRFSNRMIRKPLEASTHVVWGNGILLNSKETLCLVPKLTRRLGHMMAPIISSRC
jgi:hypothetical protein